MAISRAAHPDTMEVVKAILKEIGRKAQFIDLMTHSYRVKLGHSKDPAASIAKIQAEIDAAGWPEIKVKLMGSKYAPFGQAIGFSVPFID